MKFHGFDKNLLLLFLFIELGLLKINIFDKLKRNKQSRIYSKIAKISQVLLKVISFVLNLDTI